MTLDIGAITPFYMRHFEEREKLMGIFMKRVSGAKNACCIYTSCVDVAYEYFIKSTRRYLYNIYLV